MNTSITKSRLKELVKEVMTEENEYQAFFAKALEKAGKSIPSMSDEEKKAFFNKVDTAWNGKGEKSESVVNEEIKEKDWKTIYNVFVKFLKANTKALEIRVMMRDEDATKKAIESIISGLTNAQRSLKLK